MENIYYIGLDIHKRMVAWCLKDHSGCLVKQGEVKATRPALQEWVAEFAGNSLIKTRPSPPL